MASRSRQHPYSAAKSRHPLGPEARQPCQMARTKPRPRIDLTVAEDCFIVGVTTGCLGSGRSAQPALRSEVPEESSEAQVPRGHHPRLREPST